MFTVTISGSMNNMTSSVSGEELEDFLTDLSEMGEVFRVYDEDGNDVTREVWAFNEGGDEDLFLPDSDDDDDDEWLDIYSGYGEWDDSRGGGVL